MAGAIVVMGVSGSGKSTVGRRLARVLGWSFLDADDFHPESNRRKMAAGVALTDEDRWPWLDALETALTERKHGGVVLACSALKRAYRDRLRRAGPEVRFVFLDLEPATALQRVSGRGGHFFPADLVQSQFAALEPPDLTSEPDVTRVGADSPLGTYSRAWCERAGLIPRAG